MVIYKTDFPIKTIHSTLDITNTEISLDTNNVCGHKVLRLRSSHVYEEDDNNRRHR